MSVIYKNEFDDGQYREMFEVDEIADDLKVYIKSNGAVYSVPLVKEAVIEKEEFCAGRFVFSVIKDSVMSFNQGDCVSVKYKGEGIFYGYVFSKSRDKELVITVTCYDQMRYLKNRQTYQRSAMKLDEIVKSIARDHQLRLGTVDKTQRVLSSVAIDNVSLLDVVKSAVCEERRLSGRRFILYDDFGELSLREEKNIIIDTLTESSTAENFFYKDSIDNDVYNMVQVYTDTKKKGLREIVGVSDGANIEKWGTLILSKKAQEPESAYEEAKNLLEEYNRINREIVIRGIRGNAAYIPGCRVYLRMEMGDLDFDNYVRIKKAVHRFENSSYVTDLYVDGSVI